MNALYVAAEFSAVASRSTRLKALADQKKRGAAWVLSVATDSKLLDRYVAAAQLGITISSLSLGFYGQTFLAPVLVPTLVEWGMRPEASTGVSLAVILLFLTALQVILGELIPKSVGIGFPETLALATAAPMRLSMQLFSPLIALFNGSANLILHAFGASHEGEREQPRTADEIRMLAGESRSGGALDEVEYRLLDNALRLRSLKANQVMIPRMNILSFEADTPLSEALRTLADSPHSRAPVYEKDLDHPLGLVHINELLETVKAGDDLKLKDIVRPLPVVPETVAVRFLFRKLQKEHFHMAVVADEYGGVSGIVTLQDLIERIFGDVADEFDPPESSTLRLEGNRVHIPGTVLLVDFNDWFEASLAGRDTNTLAGFLTELHQGVPKKGTEVEAADYRFRVETTDDKMIKSVSLKASAALQGRLKEQGAL